jgi:hypothetical protein
MGWGTDIEHRHILVMRLDIASGKGLPIFSGIGGLADNFIVNIRKIFNEDYIHPKPFKNAADNVKSDRAARVPEMA